MADDTALYVSITEAARLLGISRLTVYRLIRDGLLTVERHPLYRARGPVRIRREQVEGLMGGDR